MKVRVKRSFRDSATQKVVRRGQEVEYEQWRAESLAANGFVEILDAPEDVEEAGSVKDSRISGADLLDVIKLAQTDPEDKSTSDDAGEAADETGVAEDEPKQDFPEDGPEKAEGEPFPKKDDQIGPKKRGPKPKK